MKHSHATHSHHHAKSDPEGLLRQAGLKITRPRVAILKVLTGEHGPFTTDDVAGVLKRSAHEDSAVDLVTIYRCLAKFESAGLVNRCDFGDGAVRFEIRHAGHHHHHIICKHCRRVEVLEACPVEDRSIRMPKTKYVDVSHRLEFFGICPDCQ
jgi:Fur family ferric uptake transcriptional regulator